MKYLIFIFTLLFSFNIIADVCLDNAGKPIEQNCQIVGDNPNIKIKWKHPAEREDNTDLKKSEIRHTKVYFKTEKDGGGFNWSENKVPVDFEALYIEKPAGKYNILLTTVDTGNRESESTPEIIVDAIDYVPPVNIPPSKPPLNFSIEVIVTVK